MSKDKYAKGVVSILGLSTVLACGAAEEAGQYEVYTEGANSPSASAGPLPPPGAEVQESGVLVFEHAYSDTGRFSIYEHRGGLLQAAVTGSSQDSPDRGADAIWDETFTGIFKKLAPDLEVPDALAALDMRLADYRQSIDASSLERSPLAEPGHSTAVEKSYQWFLDNVCKTFNGSSWQYIPWGCWYSGPVQYVETSVGYNNHQYSDQVNDRVYALNDSTDTTNLWICKKPGHSWCSSSVQLPPNGGWGWMHWYVPPFTNDYYGTMNTQLGYQGALGITIHRAIPLIK